MGVGRFTDLFFIEIITDEEGIEIPNPAIINTDEDYVQFVMDKASESYANQYGT
jgi:hypothetical protein